MRNPTLNALLCIVFLTLGVHLVGSAPLPGVYLLRMCPEEALADMNSSFQW